MVWFGEHGEPEQSSPSIALRAARPDRIAGTIAFDADYVRHVSAPPVTQRGSCRYPVATDSIASNEFAATMAVVAGTAADVATETAFSTLVHPARAADTNAARINFRMFISNSIRIPTKPQLRIEPRNR